MNETTAPAPVRHSGRWLRISIYYVIAFGFSAVARLSWHTNDVSDRWPSFAAIPWHLLSGIGPIIGAIVVWAVFRPRRTMSFGGTNPALAWAMLAVPAVTMAVIGIANPYGLNLHVFGFYVGAWIATYAVLEETGWRGYLQDELRDLPRLLKYFVVGSFWYLWHLTFLGHHSLGTELANFSLIVVSGIGIGYVADRTRSILAAASFHIVGNIMGLTAYFTVFIPTTSARLVVVGICVAVWLVMLRLWRRAEARKLAYSGPAGDAEDISERRLRKDGRAAAD